MLWLGDMDKVLGVGILWLVAVVSILVAVELVFRSRRRLERRSVVVESARTSIGPRERSGTPRRATLALLSTENRATVIRDIRLVADGGAVIRSYLQRDSRSVPAIPFRLEAPDDRSVVLELSDEEERSLSRIEVDFIGGATIAWPYERRDRGGVG